MKKGEIVLVSCGGDGFLWAEREGPSLESECVFHDVLHKNREGVGGISTRQNVYKALRTHTQKKGKKSALEFEASRGWGLHLFLK